MKPLFYCGYGTYTPIYFSPKEFVSSQAYKKLGLDGCLRYIDPRASYTADQLRLRFGPATINNWSFGGDRQYSGLRLPGEPHYKVGSDHSYGRALDIVFKNYTAQQIRDYIEKHPQEFPYITFIEEGESINWLHISVANVRDYFQLDDEDPLVFWSFDTRKIRTIARG